MTGEELLSQAMSGQLPRKGVVISMESVPDQGGWRSIEVAYPTQDGRFIATGKFRTTGLTDTEIIADQTDVPVPKMQATV